MKKFLVLIPVILFPYAAFSQMFSVASDVDIPATPSLYVRLGAGLNSFDYTGNPAVLPMTSRLDSKFNSINLIVENSDGGFMLGGELANHFTGFKSMTFLNIFAAYTGYIISYNAKNLRMGIPYRFGVDITTLTGKATQDRFAQTAASLGLGGKIELKFNDSVTFTNQFFPGIGVSSSKGGFFGGSVSYLAGQSRLSFLRLLGRRSVSLGYDFKKYFFNLDGERYDYNLGTHIFSIGVSI